MLNYFKSGENKEKIINFKNSKKGHRFPFLSSIEVGNIFIEELFENISIKMFNRCLEAIHIQSYTEIAKKKHFMEYVEYLQCKIY